MKVGVLAIGRHLVRLYTVNRRRGSLAVEGMKEFKDIHSVKADSGFDAFFLSLPLNSLQFRFLELPFSDKEKLHEVIPYELQGLVLKNLEEIIYDPLELSSRNGQHQILVPYIGRSELERILRLLNSKGLDPSVVTSLELSQSRIDYRPDALLDDVELSDGEIEKLILLEVQNPTINLRKGDLTFTKAFKEKERLLKRFFTLVIFLLLLTSTYLGILLYKEKALVRHVTSGMKALYVDIFPDSKKILDPLYQLKAKVKVMKSESNQTRETPALELLNLFSRKWTAKVVLDELTMTPDFVLLKGEAMSLKDVESLKLALSEELKDVELNESHRSVSGKLVFVIKVNLHGSNEERSDGNES
jgi:type II secretory pathway component PulL